MMSLPRSPGRAYFSLLTCLVVAYLAGGGSAVGQVAVAEPAAVQPLESEKIVIKDANGAVAAVGGGQWADRLPRLVQSRLIQTFENSSGLKAVGRPGDRATPDFQP